MQYINVHLRLWCDTRYSRQIMRPDMVMRPLTGAVGNSLRTKLMMKGNHHQLVRRPEISGELVDFSSGCLLVLANKHRDIKSTMWLCNGIGPDRIY